MDAWVRRSAWAVAAAGALVVATPLLGVAGGAESPPRDGDDVVTTADVAPLLAAARNAANDDAQGGGSSRHRNGGGVLTTAPGPGGANEHMRFTVPAVAFTASDGLPARLTPGRTYTTTFPVLVTGGRRAGVAAAAVIGPAWGTCRPVRVRVSTVAWISCSMRAPRPTTATVRLVVAVATRDVGLATRVFAHAVG